LVWWFGVVVWCSGLVWWFGVVVRCGGSVWWFGVVVRLVVWCGGLVQWFGVVAWLVFSLAFVTPIFDSKNFVKKFFGKVFIIFYSHQLFASLKVKKACNRKTRETV
jgi:hypothetical protein